MTTEATHAGTVAEYDAERGWGVIRGYDGERLGFHCTQIADGSRVISVGTRVRYRRIAGHVGRWEAGAVAVATD